jgi:hypothetical protein
MMSIPGQLIQLARETATRVQERAAHLRQEYLKAQALALEKKSKFDLADGALERAMNFRPLIDGQFQCPLCWIEDGRESALHTLSGDGGDDILGCEYGHKHTFPSGSTKRRNKP